MACGRLLLQKILAGDKKMYEALMTEGAVVQKAALACSMRSFVDKLSASKDQWISIVQWWRWISATPCTQSVFRMNVLYMGGSKLLHVEGTHAELDIMDKAMTSSTLIKELFPNGVHVQHAGEARMGRQRPKAMLQAVYAAMVLATDGVPRSLVEARKASPANKGNGELGLYVFREHRAAGEGGAAVGPPLETVGG